VSAVEDPDPRVAGKGHDLLRAGGVHVATGVCAYEAQRVNAGFFKRVRTSIPWVTLKIAASLDGRTALSNGDSKWITGSQARSAGHWLRATHDAILTGIGTVLADDPRLDCRLPGMAQRSPVRFVADTRGRLPAHAKLRHAPPGGQVYVLTEAAEAVEGAASIVVPRAKAGGLVVDAMLRAIGATGVTRLLVEAGPGLTTAFVRAGAADEVVWFRSGKVLGGDARAAIGALGLNDLVDAPDYARVAQSRWGEDVMETYARRP
jgi:diaminohydroxyphosphoribosylaminopyrimidine deaminase/5-amino-6-(5-phosphoribosylamino)uracil reductase